MHSLSQTIVCLSELIYTAPDSQTPVVGGLVFPLDSIAIDALDLSLSEQPTKEDDMAKGKRPPFESLVEPPHGSVVMLYSTTGRAAQRFYSDGLWRIAGIDKSFTFKALYDSTGGSTTPINVVFTAPVED